MWLTRMSKSITSFLFITSLAFTMIAEGASLDHSDLYVFDGLYFKKNESIPFSGKITGRVIAQFVHGVLDGPYEQYYNNGQLRQSGVYKNGKKNGRWISYHKNGQLHSEGKYKNGKWEGQWVDFYENGLIRSRGNYRDGKRIE